MAGFQGLRLRRIRLIAGAMIVAVLLPSPQAGAGPIPFDPDLMPIEVPPNGAFGIGYQVMDNFGSNGYVFHYVADQGEQFGVYGWPGDFYQYLTCVNENPQPGEPDHVIPAFPEGTTIDAGLETGDCLFASNTSQGRLLPDDFGGTGGFIATRGNFNPPHRYGFIYARIDLDGVLRILGGAFQSEAGLPIETTREPETVFRDRFEALDGLLESVDEGDDS